MRKFSLLCKQEIKLKYLAAKCNSLLCKNPNIYMGVGYLHAVYVHCKINFEKKLNQKSENTLRLNFEAV